MLQNLLCKGTHDIFKISMKSVFLDLNFPLKCCELNQQLLYAKNQKVKLISNQSETDSSQPMTYKKDKLIEVKCKSRF